MKKQAYYQNIPCKVICKVDDYTSVIEVATGYEIHYVPAPIEGFEGYDEPNEIIMSRFIVHTDKITEEMINIPEELLNARKTVQNAEREANKIIKEANAEASKILKDAHKSSEEKHKLIEQYSDVLDVLRPDYDKYKFAVVENSFSTIINIDNEYLLSVSSSYVLRKGTYDNKSFKNKITIYGSASGPNNVKLFETLEEAKKQLEEQCLDSIELKIKKDIDENKYLSKINDNDPIDKIAKFYNFTKIQEKIKEYNKLIEEKILEKKEKEIQEKLQEIEKLKAGRK